MFCFSLFLKCEVEKKVPTLFYSTWKIYLMADTLYSTAKKLHKFLNFHMIHSYNLLALKQNLAHRTSTQYIGHEDTLTNTLKDEERKKINCIRLANDMDST